MWKAILDLKTCLKCRKNNGKIYDINEKVYPEPPIHPYCRCIIERLKAIYAGTATRDGVKGADWYLRNYGKLPNYYITKEKAEELGYKSYLGNLSKVAPNRVWYEADINYESGFRGAERIVFSNDGLIFVTYDHYHTFTEIE